MSTVPPTTPSAQGARDLGNMVAEQLAADLFSGKWAAGDILPKETELCERFGMSRPSVRSGLQILVSLGMVRRVSGHGTIVEDFTDWNLLDPMVTRWMARHSEPNPTFIADVFEFRRATEPFISALAARKANARDLLAMEEAFNGMERTVRSGTADLPDETGRTFSDYDVSFHAAIYHATHNLVWSRLAHMLQPAILLVVRTSNTTAEELRDSLERHRTLMECIRLRKPAETFEAARHVMARTAFDLGLPELGAMAAPLPAPGEVPPDPAGSPRVEDGSTHPPPPTSRTRKKTD